MHTSYPVKPLLLTILLLTSSRLYAEPSLSIEDAWIAEAPPMSKVMAGYLKIHNLAKCEREIISVTSPDFAKIEIHRTVHENGLAKMQHQKSLVLDGNETLVLEPGGYHLMLFRPVKRLQADDSSNFSFKLWSGETLRVNAVVKKAAAQHHHPEHH